MSRQTRRKRKHEKLARGLKHRSLSDVLSTTCCFVSSKTGKPMTDEEFAEWRKGFIVVSYGVNDSDDW